MKALAAVLACCALAGCGGGERRISERLFVMGTSVDIEIISAEPQRAGDAIASAAALLTDYQRDYYAWADGRLAELNRALANGMPYRADAELARVLAAARRFSIASDGSFDPAIGTLVELWGFHRGDAAPSAPPPDAAIDTWLATRGSIADLELNAGVVSHPSTSVMIDLGGIAKGDAVDRVIALLLRRGIASALVNAGGDLRVVGTRGDRRWRVGIRAPRGADLLGAVELAPGEAAFTSGDYERFFVHDGQRLHHLLDPRTGRPVLHTQAVTVLAADGITADAAATAILVAGPDRWETVADRLGIAAALRVDASGRVELTAAMRDRFQPLEGTRPDIMLPSD